MCNVTYLPKIRQTKFLKLKKHGIRHIIFDLGGVIIDLDTSKTVRGMAQWMEIGEEEALKVFHEDDRFKQYEKGEISDAEFRDFIRGLAPNSLTDEAIDDVWNAMLLDIPGERIRLLQALKPHYSLYLLSNTNAIHLEDVVLKLGQQGISSFKELFDAEYYSHLVGMRKPDAEIYQHVLEDQGLAAQKTIFFDDNPDNIKSARSLGIQTFHVLHPNDVLTYFNG